MTTKRFDPLWRKALEAYAEVTRHARLTAQHAHGFRRHTYRFAVAVLEMQKHYQNQFVDLIKSEGKTVSQWMDDHFAIIEEMGDTRGRILSAIEAGVTEQEYVGEDHVVIARKRVKASKLVPKDDGVIPQVSSEPMTPEERVKYLLKLHDSMVSKYQGVRHELRITRQELAQAQKRMRKLERTINRLKKDLESLELGQPAEATV